MKEAEDLRDEAEQARRGGLLGGVAALAGSVAVGTAVGGPIGLVIGAVGGVYAAARLLNAESKERQAKKLEEQQHQFVLVDGQNLKKLRKEHGLSASELAKQAGVSASTIYRLEKGGRSQLGTVARLEAALGSESNSLIKEGYEEHSQD